MRYLAPRCTRCRRTTGAARELSAIPVLVPQGEVGGTVRLGDTADFAALRPCRPRRHCTPEKLRTPRAPGCRQLSPGSRNVSAVVTHQQAAMPEQLLPVYQEGEAALGIPERTPHPGVGRRALRTHVGARQPSGHQLSSPWIAPWSGTPALTRGARSERLPGRPGAGGPWSSAHPPCRYAASRRASSSAVSLSAPAATFAARWSGLPVPGMASTCGPCWRVQASRT